MHDQVPAGRVPDPTTGGYLGSEQEIAVAIDDAIGLRTVKLPPAEAFAKGRLLFSGDERSIGSASSLGSVRIRTWKRGNLENEPNKHCWPMRQFASRAGNAPRRVRQSAARKQTPLQLAFLPDTLIGELRLIRQASSQCRFKS
jgi:hypothetical protein